VKKIVPTHTSTTRHYYLIIALPGNLFTGFYALLVTCALLIPFCMESPFLVDTLVGM